MAGDFAAPYASDGGIIVIELLEPFSRQMAEDLLSVFPDWRSHFSVVARAGENYFDVRVPPLATSQGGPLEVSSLYNDEVTVFYATTHRHFFSALGNAVEPGGAIEFIQKILDERLAVVSYICTGDAIIRDGVFSSGPVPADRIPSANYEYYYATSMRVRSWRGTFDAEFAAPYVKDKPPADSGRK
ncbi:hypothetical protein [Burkholderia anthina]|uniref:hypothetical protein n=1 Tax=Burkholderia anthina TaxID=179879 RepID=UPI00158D7444|nr:hypothetical protein [Burkholderia anthina]